MKKSILLLSLAASLVVSASADTVGFEVGGAYWASKTSGNIQYKGDSIDLEKNLGYDDLNTSFFWATFEHPVPVIPNLKIQHTKFEDSANSNVTNVFNFDGVSYNGNVSSNLRLNQTDFIIYYELLDNWVNFDLGINGKYLDASVDISSANVQTSTKDLNYVIPMVYAKAKFDLPFSGFSAETDLSYIGYDANQFYDFKAGLLYETSFGLGATAGYRMEKLELDDISDVYSDIEIRGAYAGLFYHF